MPFWTSGPAKFGNMEGEEYPDRVALANAEALPSITAASRSATPDQVNGK